MSRTYRAVPGVFRHPHHKGLLREFFGARADRLLPFTVDQVIKDGSWADITPAGWSCKNSRTKIREHIRRRRAARIKKRLQNRMLRAWGCR